MTDARRQRRIESLFEELFELSASERTARLAKIAGEDPELGREVEAMLEAYAAAPSFLERSPFDDAITMSGSRSRVSPPAIRSVATACCSRWERGAWEPSSWRRRPT